MDWRRTEIFHLNEKIVEWDVFLSCPNFGEEFIIHTDANKNQLG